MSRFRNAYGAGPLHLLALIASLAVAGYGLVRITDGPDAASALLWLAAAVVAHDLVAFPLYTLFERIAGLAVGARPSRAAGVSGPSALNHVRVPALLAGLAFLLWFPLILELSEQRYEAASGLESGGFLERWLLLSAALFGASGLLYAIRLRRASRRRPGPPD